MQSDRQPTMDANAPSRALNARRTLHIIFGTICGPLHGLEDMKTVGYLQGKVEDLLNAYSEATRMVNYCQYDITILLIPLLMLRLSRQPLPLFS